MTEPAPAVQVDDLTRLFKVPFRREKVAAVRNLSLSVAPGEVYGLIGPNGSGKSTTMKVLLGLVLPSAGKSSIFGIDSRDVASRVDVGYLPENPYFYKHLTGTETLNFYARLCGLKRSTIKQRTTELLNLVDLTDAGDRRLGGYSKGMLQRVGLAAALVQNPRLVVLDEPTAGVDPAGSRMIRDLIFELKNRGITVLLCSHLLEQVQEVCDRIGIMAHGELVKESAVQDLIAVEDQTELLVRNASPELIASLRKTIADHAAEGTELVSLGHPRTTLERLFLEATEPKDTTDAS
ncbi:MAG: ABC transporter ATP-binding protein [Verrucomicrobiales bacterium]|nr:ABC transporter ATP-binding protein [Verrucomicrobiales bacterium]